jgi:hypothetical protein
MTLQVPDVLPTLAVGSHARGAKKLCLMNAISYLNGDVEITDMPSCTHPVLSQLAQYLNDSICTHRTDNILCAECASVMWSYEPLLVNTAPPKDDLEARRLAVHIAVVLARSVLSIYEDQYPNDPRPRLAIDAAEAWKNKPSKDAAAHAANAAANAAANTAAYAANAAAHAAYAANAAAHAANAAAHATNTAANAAAHATNTAAYAAAYAAHAANALRHLLDLAIDAYYEWTGREKPQIPTEWNDVRAQLISAGAL